MRPVHLSIALAALALATACMTGRSSNYPPARYPRGVQGTVVVGPSGREIHGELLAVQDSAFVLAAPRVTVVPMAGVARAQFQEFGLLIDPRVRRAPSTFELEQLKGASRFPWGITPEIMRQLLAAVPQETVDTVRAAP